MQIEQITALLRASPFGPFRILTSDGKSIPVLEPDLVLLLPDSLIVPKGITGYYRVSLEMVAGVELVSAAELEQLRKKASGESPPLG